ncbi:MAG: type II secretion system protein GspN [Nitrospira sp.]|nr:type II secretion system protein GspN [bacterium]MBL7049532.1 type II secretion system protein GspN [Nitrospira sp.]
MNRMIKLLSLIICIPVFVLLVWVFAVPPELIKEKIEKAVLQSGNGTTTLSIEGFSKGLLFTIEAQALNLNLNNLQAVQITDFSASPSLELIHEGKLSLAVNGLIGSGRLEGNFQLPSDGNMKIKQVQLKDIAIVSRLGFGINGTVSADIDFSGNTAKAIFEVPDLALNDPSLDFIPLINTFNSMQGSLSIANETISIESVSIEGEKGFARLKGMIHRNQADMQLQVMPETDKLNAMESMILGKYIKSPGYYVVPLKGPIPGF